MTKEQLLNLFEDGPVILDGATGTNLMKAGMPIGACPEKWILDNPEVLVNMQEEYIKAGTNIVYAPTFTGNRIKLTEYGLENEIESINKQLVSLSKKAVGNKGYVAGDLTMTGEQLYPMGTLQFEELVDVYKEQVKYIVEAGADLFVIETMMSLAESRAALIAVKETCDLPVMVSMTFNEDGRTLYGTDPVTATVVLQSLGADVIGVNCSTGPKEMVPIIRKIKEYANVPILAKPNAGLPELIDGETVYPMEPGEFAKCGQMLVEEGATVIGGCCGTTPDHIRELVKAVKHIIPATPSKVFKRLLCSERKTTEININGRFMVVGERINPTGKKKLQAELKDGKLDLVVEMAESQENSGADILDINMGMNGIDEKEMMIKSIYEVTKNVNLPLCIDSSHVDIIEAALRIYPGRALINSISLEKEKFEKLIPIARKYGAMFILLPLSDEGLPANIDEKKDIINTIVQSALVHGMHKEDIIVDGLVATVGANPMAALECYETINYCKNTLGLATICGLSNISFGLPERQFVNTAFLTMAIQNGLTMAIANPSQDMLMNIAFATDLLLHKKESDIRYIDRINSRSAEKTKVISEVEKSDVPKVYEAVIKGNKNNIIKLVDEELGNKTLPQNIINDKLIPAINEVGVLFDKQIYFLPQLISSAETMKIAIEYLETKIKKTNNSDKMPTIVMATVEGDIHDIGKNLVVLMLKNYGYNVIDLGKDVAKELIVDTAIKENAKVIGLSALMTTTMMRMKDVVDLVKKKNVPCKVIIGGAVITQSFADEIGADGYSKDAADAVKLVQKLLSE